MSDDLDPEDRHVVERLRAMGQERVDHVVASEHLTAMAALRRRPQKRFGRAAVAGAALAGFLLGGLGLGYADALPGPAQGVAENMLEFVGIEGEWKNRGHCISTQAQAPANVTDEAAKAAAKEQCPKGKPEGAGQQGKVKAHANDPCRGAPPWAGRGGPTAPEQAAHDQARAACGPDTAGGAGAEADEPEAEGSQVQQEQLETTDTSEATTDDTTATTEDTTATTEDTTATTEDTTATTEDTTVTTEDTTATTEAGS